MLCAWAINHSLASYVESHLMLFEGIFMNISIIYLLDLHKMSWVRLS